MANYLYLDTETTGLEKFDKPYQIAYQFEINEKLSHLSSFFLHHDLPEDRVSDYTKQSPVYQKHQQEEHLWYYLEDIVQTINRSIKNIKQETEQPVYLVGANPSFDHRMLLLHGGKVDYHHRLIDVETYAMGILGLDAPMGLNDLAQYCNKLQNLSLPDQNHDAVDDVHLLRSVFVALRTMSAPLVRPA